MSIYDANLMADKKTIGEKAASILDLLINLSHVKLPIGQAETQLISHSEAEGQVWSLQESEFQ